MIKIKIDERSSYTSNNDVVDNFVYLQILEKYASKRLIDKISEPYEQRADHLKKVLDYTLINVESIIQKYNLQPTGNKNEYYSEEGIFREYTSLIGIGAEIITKLIEETYHKMHPDDRSNITNVYNRYSEFLEYSQSEKVKVCGTILFHDNNESSINIEFKNR